MAPRDVMLYGFGSPVLKAKEKRRREVFKMKLLRRTSLPNVMDRMRNWDIRCREEVVCWSDKSNYKSNFKSNDKK